MERRAGLGLPMLANTASAWEQKEGPSPEQADVKFPLGQCKPPPLLKIRRGTPETCALGPDVS